MKVVLKNTRQLLIAGAIALTALVLSGCGLRHATGGQAFTGSIAAEGPVTSHDFNLPPFTGVKIDGTGEIILEPAPQSGISITAAENQLAALNVWVDGGVLHIKPQKSTRFNPRLVYRIQAPELNLVDLYGSFDLSTRGGSMVFRQATVALRGNGDFDFAIAGDTIHFRMDGVMDVSMAGVAQSLIAEINATGTFDARNLLTDNVKIELSGVGSAHVHAGERLEATARGVGRITYRGDPKEVVRNAVGVGQIKARL